MKQKKWKSYAFFILVTEAVGALAGLLTRNGVDRFEAATKPALMPPDMVFPIVWSVLYLLMGIGAARIWQTPISKARRNALSLFWVQLAVNFTWSLIFFGMQEYFAAFIWLILLWVLIVLMILAFWKVDRKAALLQIPYLLWVSFAGYLNWMVWVLNR